MPSAAGLEQQALRAHPEERGETQWLVYKGKGFKSRTTGNEPGQQVRNPGNAWLEPES